MRTIKFFKPYFSTTELKYIKDIFDNNLVISGDGKYTRLASAFLASKYDAEKVLLTTSGTTALELAVRLLNLPVGSEIICPSYTFSSTANAILMANGLKVRFADIDAKTLNIDPEDVAKKINKKTKAIMLVHYAGVSCDFDAFNKLAKQNKLQIIEDAAQAIDAKWKDKYLGTIGSYGCLSFHETKNVVCGEGGALFINTKNNEDFERAEIIREKGTNRSKFFRGQVDKYTWVDIGSSYLPSDILAAVLYAQLQKIELIQKERLRVWDYYEKNLKDLANKGYFRLPFIPKYATHNAHMFYVICNSSKERDGLMKHLRDRSIMASFHYIPLDTSPQGCKIAGLAEVAKCKVTEDISSRILRLPIYAGLNKTDRNRVIDGIETYYEKTI